MKTYVWSIFSRLLHWLIALLFVVAFVSGELEFNNSLHIAFGFTIFVSALVRIIWGFIGPEYSKFVNFPIGITYFVQYLKSIFDKNKKYFIGHNPIASLVMLLIYIIILMMGLTGIAILNKNVGFLNSIIALPGSEHLFKEMHEVFAKVLLILVISHLVGLTLDYFIKKEVKTLTSMITGIKHIEGNSIKVTKIQNVFSGISLIFIFFVFSYFVVFPIHITDNDEDDDDKIEYRIEHDRD